jgi:hypothetical protein
MCASPTNAGELFEQAAKMFENALQAGISVQRESSKWFNETLSAFRSPQQWQTRNRAVVDQAWSLVRKSTDDALETLNANAKASLDLLDKAFQSRMPESDSEAQARSREAFETAIGSLRRNTEVIVHANTRLLECWSRMAEIILGDSNNNQPKAN